VTCWTFGPRETLPVFESFWDILSSIVLEVLALLRAFDIIRHRSWHEAGGLGGMEPVGVIDKALMTQRTGLLALAVGGLLAALLGLSLYGLVVLAREAALLYLELPDMAAKVLARPRLTTENGLAEITSASLSIGTEISETASSAGTVILRTSLHLLVGAAILALVSPAAHVPPRSRWAPALFVGCQALLGWFLVGYPRLVGSELRASSLVSVESTLAALAAANNTVRLSYLAFSIVVAISVVMHICAILATLRIVRRVSTSRRLTKHGPLQ
jgi:hypothetical protein